MLIRHTIKKNHLNSPKHKTENCGLVNKDTKVDTKDKGSSINLSTIFWVRKKEREIGTNNNMFFFYKRFKPQTKDYVKPKKG